MQRHVNAAGDLVADRIAIDAEDAHFVVQDASGLVTSGDQIEAIDRFIDESADRFVIEMRLDAADDLGAHLFGYLEDFERRADGFVRESFEFSRMDKDRIWLQMGAFVQFVECRADLRMEFFRIELQSVL